MGDRPALSVEEDYYVNDTDTLAIPGQVEEDSPDYENIPGSSRSLSKPEPEPEIRPRGRKKKKKQGNQDRNHSNPVGNHGNPDPDQSQDVEDEGHYLALRNTVVESVTKDEAPKPPPDIPEKIIVTAPATKTADATPAEPEKVVLPSKKRRSKVSKCSRNKVLCAVFSTIAVAIIAALLGVILWKFFYLSGAHCGAAPCQNGGTCVEMGASYMCVCPEMYLGRNCQVYTDDCAGAPCLNGGTCEDGLGNYRCLCGYGYSGNVCETADCAIVTCTTTTTEAPTTIPTTTTTTTTKAPTTKKTTTTTTTPAPAAAPAGPPAGAPAPAPAPSPAAA